MRISGKARKISAYIMRGLPLAGILYGAILPGRANLHPLLILATLVWFQVLLLFEVFTFKN